MPRIYPIEPDGSIYARADDVGGITLEADMDPRDTLPAHVIPCPDRHEWRVEAWPVLS